MSNGIYPSDLAFGARPLSEESGDFGWGIGFVQWGIHTHCEIWRVSHLKGEVLKKEIACLWMIDRFAPFFCPEHLMIGPPGSKFRAGKHHIMDQLSQAMITGI